MIGEWIAQNPEFAWSAVSGATCLAVYYFGDRWFARKPRDGREYAIQPTEEEARAARKAHEEETIRLCNDVYVQRERYHKDMDLLTGQVAAIQLDIGKFTVMFETLNASIGRLVSAGEKQAEKLAKICEHAASVDGAWSEWKRQEPLVIVRDRIVGTADQLDDIQGREGAQ